MEKQKIDIVSKKLNNKEEMIRFVQGPDDKIYPDLSENLPGKGMWITADKKEIQTAIKKKLFDKLCKDECQIDAGFINNLSNLFKKRILTFLSISKKSGDFTQGFDKVIEQIKKDNVKILIIAKDSGHDGIKKIQYALKKEVLIIDVFSAKELEEMFHSDGALVYASIRPCKLSKTIIQEYKKFKNIS